MNETTARNRSYQIRRTIAVGSQAVVADDFPRGIKNEDGTYRRVVIETGTVVTVTSYTNAGFRGIEANVVLPDGTPLYGVNAGLLNPMVGA